MREIRLQSFVARFWGESEEVFRRFSHVFPRGHEACSDFHNWTQEMCAVRLQDAWARFCRELVLASASKQPLTMRGSRVPLAPGIAQPIDALNALRVVYNRFPHEPRWFDAQACLKAATILRVANYAAISAGVGVTPSPLDDLRDLRNFLVHRGEVTAARVRAAAMRNHLPANYGALEILRSGATMPNLQLWVEQLQLMAQIAAG